MSQPSIWTFAITFLITLWACKTPMFFASEFPPPRKDRPTATVSTWPRRPWDLWQQGTSLRGANIYQRRVYPELDGDTFMGPGPLGPPYTQEDFNRLAALGANYINISHPGLFTENPPYTVDPDVEANLDRLVQMAARADLFVVITFRTGPGRSEFWAFWGEDTQSDPENGWFPPTYYNNRVWNDAAAQDAWVRMWRYTAQHYRDNPTIIGYDLMCEPNANEVGSYPLGPPLNVWTPVEFYQKYGGTLYDWNQLYPRIVQAVRNVDPETPILIGGMGYSHVAWLPYMRIVDADYIVYTVHQYEPFPYTHRDPPDPAYTYPGDFDADADGSVEHVDREWLANLLVPIQRFQSQHHVPIAVNEYGAMRWEPGVAHFMEDEMALFEAFGVNYALWLWESSWEPYASEVDAFNFRHGPDPHHHKDITDSELIRIIRLYWQQNTVRPSHGVLRYRIFVPVLGTYTSFDEGTLPIVRV